MLSRCSFRGDTNYKRYGAKGISVCARWRNYLAFLEDMGERPMGMTLDRIDSTKDYSPDNCRWATMKTQQRNRTNNLIVEFRGERLTASAWEERLSLPYGTISRRLKLNWPAERALTEPVRLGRRPLSRSLGAE